MGAAGAAWVDGPREPDRIDLAWQTALVTGLALALALRAVRCVTPAETRVRPWTLAIGAALALSALMTLARISPDGHVVAPLILLGALVVAAVAGALTLMERAGHLHAVRLRARLGVTLAIAVTGALGCLAAGLQVVFTHDALEKGSQAAGYAAVMKLLKEIGPMAPSLLTVPGAVLGAAVWARLCHTRLWRQALAGVSLCWIGPTAVVLARRDLGVDPLETVLWLLAFAGVVPVLALIGGVRGLEQLERRFFAIEPSAPRPLPEGSGRRVALAVLGVVLAATFTHVGLTRHYSTARDRVLDALRVRGEPLSVADLGPAPPEEDAYPCYQQAVASKTGDPLTWNWKDGPRVRVGATPAEAAEAAAVCSRALIKAEAWLVANARTFEHLFEAGRRPRCRLAPRRTLPDDQLAAPFLEAALLLALQRNDPERAAELIAVRFAQAAALEPEAHCMWTVRWELQALTWIVPLLEKGEPSAVTCRRLLERVGRPPSRDWLLRMVRGVRLELLDARGHSDAYGPFATRLGWWRDRDLVHGLKELDRTAADFAAGRPVAPHPGDDSSFGDQWTPSTSYAEWARNLPTTLAELTTARGAIRAALELRLHRLEKGTYPAAFAEVPAGVTYTRAAGGGFTLTGIGIYKILPMTIPR